ncbi:MAG: AAA family ATPase [Archangium sp.]
MGTVKIVSRDGRPVPHAFDKLDPAFCSLGQSVQYFARVRSLDTPDILERLRDIHFDRRFGQGFDTNLLDRTLRRFPTPKRIASTAFGGDFQVPSKFSLKFRTKLDGFDRAHAMTISFDASGPISRRVAVLIGASGTGKTGVLSRLAQAAVGDGPQRLEFQKPPPLFHSVVGVAYGVMQPFSEGSEDPESYIYCGAQEFESFESGHSAVHFERIVEHLPKNRIGEWAKFWNEFTSSVGARMDDTPMWVSSRTALFDRLSAGHRMYAMICASLISRVPDNSLVLLDEPETHLHPSLLCSLLDVLFGLLGSRNSFAIIATHSPLVAQSMLARQVLIFRNQSGVPIVDSPDRETLGCGLSELTEYVFDYPNIESRPFLNQLETAARQTPRRRLRRLFAAPTTLPLEIILEHARFRGRTK